MVSLLSAVIAAIITTFTYWLEWATTLIPLGITFLVAWFIVWVLIRLGRGDAVEEIIDTFWLVWLIKAFTDD